MLITRHKKKQKDIFLKAHFVVKNNLIFVLNAFKCTKTMNYMYISKHEIDQLLKNNIYMHICQIH